MNKPYVLGHSARELDRLELQGLIYRDATRRALLDGGLEAGMRVLDIGCGSGDVSRLAAEIVGPTGSVTGVDRDQQTIADARARCLQSGIKNIVFAAGEAASVAVEDTFDALVGRFVLMHQPDPATMLAEASRAVRQDGVLIMLESHMAALLNGQHSFPRSAVYDEVVRWKCRVVAAAGANIETGLGLYQIFRAAGLPAPSVRMEAIVEGGSDSLLYPYMAESIRSMLPIAETHGISGFDSAGVARLEARLRDEVLAANGVIVCWPVAAAWCRMQKDKAAAVLNT